MAILGNNFDLVLLLLNCCSLGNVSFVIKNDIFFIEASRGAGAQSVTVKPTGCGFDPHARR